MLYLDVYNILHVTGVLPVALAGIDLHGLLQLIATSRYNQQEIVAVCDGVRPAHLDVHHATSTLAARVLFSGDASDADGLIEKLLAATPRSKKPMIISSDHRLRKAAGKAHARHLRSEVFLHHLAIDLARHDRGESKDSRRAQQARPAFATDIPLDHLSTQKWLSDLEATAAEKEALAEASRAADVLSQRLLERPAPRGSQPMAHETLPGAARSKHDKHDKRGSSEAVASPKERSISQAPAAAKKSKPAKLIAASPSAVARGQAALTTDDRQWLIAAGLTEADLDMNLWLKKGPSADTHKRL